MKSSNLTVSEKIAFASGDVAINFLLAAFAFFLPYFYTDIYGIDPIDMGVLFFVARIVDALTDPLMGLITDKVKTKYGRYRHYFLYLAVPFGFSFVLLFSTPDLAYNFKLIWIYATYLVVTLIFTAIAIPYISYIGVLTRDPSEKISANGYRMILAKMAGVSFVTAIPLLVQFFGNDRNSAVGYLYAMIIFGTIAALLLFCCFKFTRERIDQQLDTSSSLFLKFKVLLNNDQWVVLCAVCLVGTFAYALRGSVAFYYAIYFLKCDDVQASWFISSGIAMSILSTMTSTTLCKYFCKIQIFRWSQICAGGICIIMYFTISPGDIVLAFGLNLLLCYIVDFQAPIFWSAIAEAVDYGQRKNGLRVSGLSFATISLGQKVGGGFAGLVLGVLLGFLGYDAKLGDQQTPMAINGMSIMLVLIPGICHILMGIIMNKYKITDTFYTKMMKIPLPSE